MIRKAEEHDISRIAEILIFGKRTAYRPIFKDDLFSFNELQVFNVIQEYMQNPEKCWIMFWYMMME
jgi:putative acetyltransferase